MGTCASGLKVKTTNSCHLARRGGEIGKGLEELEDELIQL